MKKTANNSSAKKKLIPAAGALAISAAMLSTSTYAWFTMSREVEVTNLQMTATVPEDIQLSLGKLNDGELNKNTGTLVGKSNKAADDGNVDDPAVSTDWSNLADISKYYQFGKMIPASSTTGANIYFTPNANGVGKTVASDAKYYDAAVALAAQTEDLKQNATTTYNTTVHANTSASDSWSTTSYKAATGWNTTENDGYYIDVPVWLRTSSEKGASLSVQAYVKPKTSTTTETNDNDKNALYRAVRVSVLSGEGTSLTNIIPVADGWNITGKTLKENPFDLGTNDANSIVNYYTGRVANVTDAAVKAEGTGASTETYEAVTRYNKTGVITLAPGSDGTYGEKTKVIIRIWLEGEDPDCWNDTAGQDWSINLKFNNETTNPNGASKTDISGVDTSIVMTTPKEAAGGNGGNG